MNDSIWNKNFICVLVVNFIMAAGFNAIIPTLPIYLKHQLNFSSSDIGLIL